LQVELLTPKTDNKTVEFHFPRIIPGTYSISDYGRFVTNLKAFDANGKELSVKKISDNAWTISKARKLFRITYTVEDIFDSQLKHGIYPMAATNIEKDTNFVFNNPGFFGFMKGMNQVPFELHITKPAKLFASTALKQVSTTATKDVFRTRNLDEFYDAPIMYSVPDTTTIKVGNTEVLISVYSPRKNIQSKMVADWLDELLEATSKYLGGKLPAERYAFLYYFVDLQQAKHSFTPGMMGALEHQTASFYYLPDIPAQQIKSLVVDVSSHEFFHIITPLTIASREVKEFNFIEPVMSQHLWLYEGVTEYTAHHVQVKNGLNSVKQFLDKLSGKITTSRKNYNDTLAFTVLSKEAAGIEKKQYGNVYEKGALIAAVLDIYLLHLSGGNYGLRNLTYDLGVRYGKERWFNDDELFSEIGKLSYPEVKTFLERYVAGNEAIPYEYYFGLAGIRFTPKIERKVVSFGGITPGVNKNGVLFISPQSKFNDFGKQLGYKAGDELYAFNGVKVTPQNVGRVIDSLKKVLQEGDRFEVQVGRPGTDGNIQPITLSAPVVKITETELNKLEPIGDATTQQQLVREAWLSNTKQAKEETFAADMNDVQSIDAIIKAVYDVISGPPGPRNWQRFRSLFAPGAKMGATVTSPSDETEFHTMSPAGYQESNAPFFMQSGFFEEELGRTISQYGNVASVQSAYQFRMSQSGEVEQRGVNHFTLVKSKGRWWVTSLVWQDETKDNPIPAHLLKK
jgi:predicted metalloprotease with PDZ domain